MKFLKNGNWGLRLLALVLAIVIYHALKNEPALGGAAHERNTFQSH